MINDFYFRGTPAHLWKHYRPNIDSDASPPDYGKADRVLNQAIDLIIPFVVMGLSNSAALYLEWEHRPELVSGCGAAWLKLKRVPATVRQDPFLQGSIQFGFGTLDLAFKMDRHLHVDGHELWSICPSDLQRHLCDALTYHVSTAVAVKSAILYRCYADGCQIRPLVFHGDAGFIDMASDRELAQMLGGQLP